MTTENKTVVFTENQIRVASAVASEFGHTWGGIELPPDLPRTTRAIEGYVTNVTTEGVMGWGICSPAAGPHNCIYHMTASGRLEWEIYDESAIFTYSRSDGVIAAFAVLWASPDRPLLTVSSTISTPFCSRVYQRHVDQIHHDIARLYHVVCGALGTEMLDGEIERCRQDITYEVSDRLYDECADIQQDIARLQRRLAELKKEQVQ